jgi:hypothetical protein
MFEGLSRFAEGLQSNPNIQRSRLQAMGYDPMAVEKHVQPLVAERKNQAVDQQISAILGQIGDRDPTPQEVMQLFRLKPESAKFMLQMKKEQRLADKEGAIASLLGGGAQGGGDMTIDQAYMAAESDNPALAGMGKAMIAEMERSEEIEDFVTKEEIKQGIQLEKERRSPTSAQSDAYTFAKRMVAAGANLPKDVDKELRGGGEALAGSVPLVGNYLISPKYQAAKQAADDWLTANLRKESGAAISVDEMASEYKKYFPIPGDSDKTVMQKRQSRKEAEKGMVKAAGILGESIEILPLDADPTEDLSGYSLDELNAMLESAQ